MTSATLVLDVSRRLADALHASVIDATRRMRDDGLRDRVLAAEGRHVVAEHDRRAAGIEEITQRRWTDMFGLIHCPCGRIVGYYRHLDSGKPCICGGQP
jgi:ribosomal protein L34